MIDIREIQDILPHRYPFLLVDKVTEFEPGVKITGLKNVTFNEPFFEGHFPGNPIMPGVLIVEAMAQTAGIMSFRSGSKGNAVLFMSIEKAKFRKPVVPGDQLLLEIAVLQQRGSVCKFSGRAVVEGQLVAEAEFTAMTLDSRTSGSPKSSDKET